MKGWSSGLFIGENGFARGITGVIAATFRAIEKREASSWFRRESIDDNLRKPGGVVTRTATIVEPLWGVVEQLEEIRDRSVLGLAHRVNP